MQRFTSILIANRGEIACRIIRTAKALGYRTIAVYSDPDAQAPHVRLADEAVGIGPGAAAESYLAMDKIIAAAVATGAGAVHPGYGFLSENADLADACHSAGITFIGPPAEAIRAMGNKAQAKRRMIDNGVPCVPGYEGEDQTDDTLLREAKKIGLPLMVKAAAGGGGRGMRLVHEAADLASAIDLARAEGETGFGSAELILEKAILRSRHVEIQVFADNHGTVLHLGERDCSVQRRHQKVIEEAPCPVINSALRERMGTAAITAARSIDYRGAGTVEFLLDESGEFYFLEMNTRLQVEHPLTEQVTGLDLVALQISVAQGEPLGLAQTDVSWRGHAIEVRLYTEDPGQNFLPTPGPIALWLPPAGPGIRVDDGIRSGQTISPYYDPMVAKIIASGPDRETARLRLIEALRNTVLFGTPCNREFLLACLENPCFAAGEATTAFITEEFGEQGFATQPVTLADSAAAAVVDLALDHRACADKSLLVAPALRDWSNASPLVSRKQYAHGEVLHDLSVSPLGNQRYTVSAAAETHEIVVQELGDPLVRLTRNGESLIACYHADPQGRLYLSVNGQAGEYRDLIPEDGLTDNTAGSGDVTAPMHGLLKKILVSSGDQVAVGDTLAVLEAMKMHYEITAEVDGEVTEIVASAGTQVAADELLLQITAAEQ